MKYDCKIVTIIPDLEKAEVKGTIIKGA